MEGLAVTGFGRGGQTAWSVSAQLNPPILSPFLPDWEKMSQLHLDWYFAHRVDRAIIPTCT